MNSFFKFLTCVIGCELVGIISIPFTLTAIPVWYSTLNKPPFSPPNLIFGPVWTLLYFLMGVAMFLIWQKGLKNKKVKKALFYFLIQLSFNFLWSFLFFGLHSPLLGLLDILALLVSIVLTLRIFYNISRPASYLLLPYLLWVGFATILNAAIVVLNK